MTMRVPYLEITLKDVEHRGLWVLQETLNP